MESRIEFAVAVAGRAIVLLLVSQVDVVLHHLIDLYAQLLVHFPPDDARVNKEGYEEAYRHHQQCD